MRSVKRLRERAALFAALFGVTAIVSGLGVGLIGYLAFAEAEGTKVELAARTGPDYGLEVSLDRDADWQAQDALVRTLLAEEFTNGDRPIPIAIDRTVESASNVPVVLPDEAAAEFSSAVVLSVPELSERAALVDGTWPRSVDEVSVQADAAALLGITPGMRVQLGATQVTVTATWRAIDSLDPRWLGDQRVVSGIDGVSVGPIVIDEGAWEAVDAPTRARWTIVPIVEQLHSSDLAAILVAWDGIRNEIRNGGVDTGSFDERGRLARTVQQVQDRIDALRAVQPVALLILAAVALVSLLELARLLGTIRSSELRLMWSRGGTALELAAGTAAETAIVCGFGAALGTAGAALALSTATGGSQAIGSAGAAVWMVPAAAALVAVAMTSAMTHSAARSFSRPDRPHEAGRVRRAAGPGAAVLVTVAAALSTWQLLLYGSPITPARGGGSQVDPVAVLAPALALVSLVLLAVLAAPLATPLIERAARGSVGVGRATVSRTLVRRPAIAATSVVVIALATGQIVLAAGYEQTWNNAYTLTTELRSGSQLRLSGTGDDLAPERIDALVGGGAISAVAPVFRDTIVVGLDAASLVGVAPSALRDLATGASGLFDRAGTAELIAADLPGTIIPEGATSLRATVRADGVDGPIEVSILLADEYGTTRTVPTDADRRADIPPLAPGVPGAWRFAGIDITVPTVPYGSVDPEKPPTIEVTSIETDDGMPFELGDDWTARWLGTLSTPLEVPRSGPGAILYDGVDRVRLLPTLGTEFPAVISQALATRNSIVVGDVLPIQVDARADDITFVVTAIVPAVPSAQYDAAVLIDLGIVQAARWDVYPEPAFPRELWIESDDEVAAMELLREGLPSGVRIQSLAVDPSRGILQSGSIALWIGAGGTALLAFAAVAAVIGAQLRSRRAESLVLRALGMSAGAIGTIRRWELVWALGLGGVVGLIAGLAVTLLTVPALASAAVPEPYGSLPATAALDIAALGAALAGSALLLAVLVLWYERGVARQVRRGSSADDTR